MPRVDEFRQRLVESQLESAPLAAEYVDRWCDLSGETPDAPAERFAQWLVHQELLTDFQADALLSGHAGPFLLGPYRVSEHLAVGRLGGLFRGMHEEFQQPVSLKVFPASLASQPDKLIRVGREARILAELNHDHVVRSFHVGHVGDTYFLVLEDLHGETLAARLRREGPLPYRAACRLVRDIARGLEHLHANEVLHLELRPEHVWLAPGDVPKIMEFGAARDALAYVDALADEENQENQPAPALIWPDVPPDHFDYMAPEQALDDTLADARSDIYSIGCVLYECLVGHPPFIEAQPLKMALLHAMVPPQPPTQLVPDLPQPVEQTLLAMIAKNPADRFQSARDVAYALDQYAEHASHGEEVHVIDVSSEYLRWASSLEPPDQQRISEESVGVTPELTNFLNWMESRTRRRRRATRQGPSPR